MTSVPNPPTDGNAANAPARNLKERALVFIVVFLGLLILAGLAAVIVKIIYLSSTPPAQRASSDAAAGGPASAPRNRLELPAGAEVKSISVNGDRLAVHYEAPGGAAIAVLDLASGAVVRRVEVVPGGATP
jgi:hypothetical protein